MWKALYCFCCSLLIGCSPELTTSIPTSAATSSKTEHPITPLNTDLTRRLRQWAFPTTIAINPSQSILKGSIDQLHLKLSSEQGIALTRGLLCRYPVAALAPLDESTVLKKKVKGQGLFEHRIKHFCELNGSRVVNTRVSRLDKELDGHIFFSKEGRDFCELKSPLVKWGGKECGFEDPRVFSFQDTLFILVNGKGRDETRQMYLYNERTDKWVKLHLKRKTLPSTQKNWTPYIYNDQLYFIYSISPLAVIKVEDVTTGLCALIKGPLSDPKTPYGSTPLIPWLEHYFVGFAHTRKPYRAVPILYDAKEMEVVRIGEPILFKNPAEAIPWRNKSVQFPYDLQILGDTVRMGVEFEDRCPTWLYFDLDRFCRAFPI